MGRCLNARLAEGMAWHFTFMWGFDLNGFAYVSYALVSSDWQHPVNPLGRRSDESTARTLTNAAR